MKEQILSLFNEQPESAATVSFLLTQFTFRGEGGAQSTDDLFGALDELVTEGMLVRYLDEKLGWLYCLPSPQLKTL